MTEESRKNVIKVSDIRMQRPVVFHEKSSGKSIVVQTTTNFMVGEMKIEFFSPNNVSLFLSIAHREAIKAKNLYESIFNKPQKGKRFEIKGRELKRLYNYLEHVQSAIISIYTAIESLANVAIPPDFKLEKRNGKGVLEIWDKKSIERWLTTSEKIKDVVPKILDVPSPSTLALWQDFRALEEARNEIIHQKTSRTKKNEVDSSFIGDLLQPEIFKKISSGFDVIRYFCLADKKHGYFPLGFGHAELSPIEVDRFEDALEPIDE